MATIRLIPSAYTLSNTQYLSISDASNMYANTDSTSYATITHNRSQNSTYYLYISGFNFSSINSDWVINSFTVKLKALESQLSTSSSYRCSLYNYTTSIANTTLTSSLTTSAATYTFPTTTLTWDTIKGYGSNFRIRVPLRRASSGTSGYVRVYGAEIEVDYTAPVAATVTSTLTGSGTISPSGAYSCYEGDTYELHITPTNASDTVTVTNNGTDVTSKLISPGTVSKTDEEVLGTYALTSGGFNGQGGSYFSGIVGHGYDTTSTTTSNYYSSGSGTIAVFTYDMGVDIPSDATVTGCYVMVNGHAESTTNNSEYMCVQLYAGSTAISSELNFKSVGTSNSTQTIQATSLPTAAQCANLKLQCRLGYYGGAINGATVFVTYTATTDYYTYTYTVTGNATIAVTIGGGAQTTTMYVKLNGSWVAATAVYKKVNGSWVAQSNLTSVFTQGTNYLYSS